MVSFCWKMNFPHNKIKINSVLLMMSLKLTIKVVAFFLGHPVYVHPSGCKPAPVICAPDRMHIDIGTLKGAEVLPQMQIWIFGWWMQVKVQNWNRLYFLMWWKVLCSEAQEKKRKKRKKRGGGGKGKKKIKGKKKKNFQHHRTNHISLSSLYINYPPMFLPLLAFHACPRQIWSNQE